MGVQFNEELHLGGDVDTFGKKPNPGMYGLALPVVELKVELVELEFRG